MKFPLNLNNIGVVMYRSGYVKELLYVICIICRFILYLVLYAGPCITIIYTGWGTSRYNPMEYSTPYRIISYAHNYLIYRRWWCPI